MRVRVRGWDFLSQLMERESTMKRGGGKQKERIVSRNKIERDVEVE